MALRSRSPLRKRKRRRSESGVRSEGSGKSGGQDDRPDRFLLARSTDQKVVVLLEARKTCDKSAWFYALARLNQHKYVVSYYDREVQVFPFVPFQDRDDPLEPYTKFFNQL